jgi:WD40 repeat protein
MNNSRPPRVAVSRLAVAGALLTSTLLAQVPDGRVELASPSNHTGFRSWAFSPDGKRIAGGTGRHVNQNLGGELILWDARKGTIVRNFGPQGAHVDFVAFSADGKALVSGCTTDSDNGWKGVPHIRVWDARRGKMKRELIPGAPAKRPPCLSPDGRSLVWLGQIKDFDNPKPLHFEVWDLKTGKLRWKLDKSGVCAFAVSPDGGTVVASYEHVESVETNQPGVRRIKLLGKGLVAWSLSDGKQAWRAKYDDERSFAPGSIAFVGKGAEFVMMKSGGLTVHDGVDGRRLRSVKLEGFDQFDSVVISDDGKRLASVDFMQEHLMIWDLASGERVLHLTTTERQSYGDVCFSKNLDRVAGNVPEVQKSEFQMPTPGVLRLKLR